MNSILLTIALKSIQWWIGSGIFLRITDLVDYMMNDTRTGAEKREYVVDTIKDEFTIVGGAIRAVIEVYLLKSKV
jgi:hypothetical protein